MKMNSNGRSGPVILQLLRIPDGVKAVFDDGGRAPEIDSFPSGGGPADRLTFHRESDSGAVADHFLTLRNLAGDLFDLIAVQGAKLGWSVCQVAAFQAPVARIRDAAQAVLDKRRG